MQPDELQTRQGLGPRQPPPPNVVIRDRVGRLDAVAPDVAVHVTGELHAANVQAVQ